MGRKNKESIILNGVRIESVAAEGKAIAHVHIGDDDREGGSCGRVIFVEYAVPGNIVKHYDYFNLEDKIFYNGTLGNSGYKEKEELCRRASHQDCRALP